MVALPTAVEKLFWEVDPATIDLDAHADYVMERVMLRGGWDAMRWLRAVYPTTTLQSYLIRKGRDRLSPRELAYWSLITGLPDDAAPGGGRPPWAGP